MAQFGNHEYDAQTAFRWPQRPLGIEFLGERQERVAQVDQVCPQRMGIDRHPREEPSGVRIGKLMHLGEIASMLGDEAGNAREQSDTIRTGELEERGWHVREGPSSRAATLWQERVGLAADG